MGLQGDHEGTSCWSLSCFQVPARHVRTEFRGLYGEYIGLHREYIGLYREYIGLYRECIGLYREYIGLYRGNGKDNGKTTL